jgi:hypothetical protein
LENERAIQEGIAKKEHFMLTEQELNKQIFNLKLQGNDFFFTGSSGINSQKTFYFKCV